MTTDAYQHDAELNSLLRQLAHFFKINETRLSPKDCEYCLGRLPDNDQSALKKLFRMLHREENSTSGSSDEQDHPLHDSRSSPDQTASGTSHETSPNRHEETTRNPSDSDEDTLDAVDTADDEDDEDVLRDTNFSHCVVKPPPSVNDVLVRCIKDPHHFFTAVTRGSIPSKGGFPDAFCRVYKRKQHVDMLRIHRRFDLQNLYALAVKLGYHTGEKWTWGALNKVPGEILSNHPSLGLTEGEIKEHLIHYVRIGRGYGRWIKHFGDPGYLIALPLDVTETEYTENRYSKCIPAAARKLRELGIDDVVKNLELSNLGEHIAQGLLLEFNPLNPKTKRVTKRKEAPIDADETATDTDDRIDSSTSPVNASQTQGTHAEPSRKRHRPQDDDFVASAPFGTSPFPTSNTNLAANIRPINASQIPFDDAPNEQSVSLPEETPPRALHGQISDSGVFYPSDYYPNLAVGTQIPPDPELPDGFNALNFPSLAVGTQIPPDSQLPDGFNALNFPSLAVGTQIPPDSQLPDGFNALNFPSLALDAQIPPDPELPDGFNALNFPSLALDAQLSPDPQLPDGFNALNFPNLVLGT